MNHRGAILFITKTSPRAEVLALKVLSVGVSVAVRNCRPVTAGFQAQTAVAVGAAPEVETALQLGIRLPL
jgi:hypothetical protein